MRRLLTRPVEQRLLQTLSNPAWGEQNVDEALCFITASAIDLRTHQRQFDEQLSVVNELIARLQSHYGGQDTALEMEASIRSGECNLGDFVHRLASSSSPWTQVQLEEAVASLKLAAEEVYENQLVGEGELAILHLNFMVAVVERWIRERGAETRRRVVLKHFVRSRTRQLARERVREDFVTAGSEVA